MFSSRLLKIRTRSRQLDPNASKRFRSNFAAIAERTANSADTFASILEQTSARGDSDRRKALAAVEREIARIERRNASKARRTATHPGPLDLEDLPHLPGYG